MARKPTMTCALTSATPCLVNLYLHGVGASGDVECPVRVGDSLNGDPGDRFDMVLTNPPFGKTWSNTVVNEEGRADRQTLKYERADY